MRIIFDFSGGPFDGETVECDTSTQTGNEPALQYYSLSDNGRVGARFWTVSPAALESMQTDPADEWSKRGFSRHEYKIADHLEEGDEVLVRAEYLGPGG